LLRAFLLRRGFADAMKSAPWSSVWARTWPLLAVLGSVTALGLGTSLAKQLLFPALGAQGTSALRLGFAALILLALWRPWRWPLQRRQALALLRFGLAIGGMNLLFYMALRSVPFGLGVLGLEFDGGFAAGAAAVLAARQGKTSVKTRKNAVA